MQKGFIIRVNFKIEVLFFMFRSMLKSKIHRAVVTDADLSYEGSLTIDEDLMKAADILPFEQIMVYNIANGERFETYAIAGEGGSGKICLNGAAARKGAPGDLIIIVTYGKYSEEEIKNGKTILVWVDDANNVVKKRVVNW